MAGTGEGKKEEADYKRLHSFPLIRVTCNRVVILFMMFCELDLQSG